MSELGEVIEKLVHVIMNESWDVSDNESGVDGLNVVETYDLKPVLDALRKLDLGNVYQTHKLAIRARDRQLLLVELQDYANQKNAGRIIKSNSCYYLDITGGSKWMPFTMGYEMLGIIWFVDKQDADAAIAHFGDRLDLLL